MAGIAISFLKPKKPLGVSAACATSCDHGTDLGWQRKALWPVDVASEAAVAASMVTGQTDQAGDWQAAALKPGKYYVGALMAIDRSPECMGALWRARQHATEVEIEPKVAVPVTLSPMALR